MREKMSLVKDFLEVEGLLGQAEFYKELAGLTTIGSGGQCLCFLNVLTKKSLSSLLKRLLKQNIGFLIIGDGSNILFSDGLHELIVIRLSGEFDYLEFMQDGLARIGAGYNLQRFVVKAAKKGLDFSFLAGIPGTIGGAVIGNSGTAEESIGDHLKSIEHLEIDEGEVRNSHMEIRPGDTGYRSLNRRSSLVITDVVLAGNLSSSDEIIKEIRERIKLKKRQQPSGSKNAGCFFKNPGNKNHSAGALIDGCRLRGFSYGGARISELHANFIENVADASSKDIFILSRIIKDIVEKKHCIGLEYEVNLVGLDEI